MQPYNKEVAGPATRHDLRNRLSKMNGANPGYQWPTGYLQRPLATDHALWTGRPGTPIPTPKFSNNTHASQAPLYLPPISPYHTPGWIATPLPSPFIYPAFITPAYHTCYPTPAPARIDLPPLVPDEDEDDDFPLLMPPPPPMQPSGHMATPVQTLPLLQVAGEDLLRSARMRALNESSIPLMRIARRRVKGRPAHWRVGYKPDTCTRMKRCFAKPVCTSTTHTLHTLIAYQFPRNFPIMLDLRRSYVTTVFHNPERYSSTVDLYQLATNPPLHEMQLYHPLLPWHVDIRASSSSGITIYDILTQLCTNLQTPIVPTDLHNDVLSSDDRERFYSAYLLRTSGSPEIARGICRVDFLGSEALFRGLTRTREGWLIKTTLADFN